MIAATASQLGFDFGHVSDGVSPTYATAGALEVGPDCSYLNERDRQTVREAEAILLKLASRPGQAMVRPTDMMEFFQMRLAHLMHEEFHIAHLNNKHRILDVQCLFKGTVDGASVHPREVVRACLAINSVAVVFAHGHPSGDPTPSAADRAITRELTDALSLVGVRVLDHIVVAASGCVSMAAKGLM